MHYPAHAAWRSNGSVLDQAVRHLLCHRKEVAAFRRRLVHAYRRIKKKVRPPILPAAPPPLQVETGSVTRRVNAFITRQHELPVHALIDRLAAPSGYSTTFLEAPLRDIVVYVC